MSESLATRPHFVGATPSEISWQQAMKSAIRTAEDLANRLELPEGFIKSSLSSEGLKQFPLFVPLEFLRRMEKGNPTDPLFRQVWPWSEESLQVPGYSNDPVGEQSENRDFALPLDGPPLSLDGLPLSLGLESDRSETTQGSLAAPRQGRLLMKYHGRALLIAHQACGVHCRYCFRRHFPYQQSTQSDPGLSDALDALRDSPDIREVLLSGGDPLVMTDPALFELIDRLEEIPHLQRLRIHSRMPIVIPQRSTFPLISRLRESRLTPWLVVHCNHANELDESTGAMLSRWIDGGIPVLNQAVLLAGVNDSVEALETLCERLIQLRIQPYYLHQLDRVNGASHFEVDRRKGSELVAALRERLPGYAVPTFVCEEPGKPSKTPLSNERSHINL